jgi:hypothetical protein
MQVAVIASIAPNITRYCPDLLPRRDTLASANCWIYVAINSQLVAIGVAQDNCIAGLAKASDNTFDNCVLDSMNSRANINANILPLMAAPSAKPLIPVWL